MKKFILSLLNIAIAASAFAAIVTPADPTNVKWTDSNSEDGYSRLTFTLPSVDVNGNALNSENLGYRIYTDDGQIFTFERSVYSNDALYSDATSIYYYTWSAGSDIQRNGVYFYRTNAEGFDRFFTWRIGIQAFYTNEDGTGESNIVYDEVFPQQAALPKPANPEVEEWLDHGGVGSGLMFSLAMNMNDEPVADDYPGIAEEIDATYIHPHEIVYTVLDADKVTYSIYTDNDEVFVFSPDVFVHESQLFADGEGVTQIPFSYDGWDIYGQWNIEFPFPLTNKPEYLEEGQEPYFNWRIGVQTRYTDDGQTSTSDIMYMEIYPQLQEAKDVTSTSFLADWSCNAENTRTRSNFDGYVLYVINKATQDTVLIQNVEPTNPQSEINEQGQSVLVDNPIPGATCTVEGLTPGETYEFYVVQKHNKGVLNYTQSVVREVTLPTAGGHIRPGDVNHDGNVDVQDVTMVINYALGKSTEACPICANVNGDENIDVADVSMIINIALGKTAE